MPIQKVSMTVGAFYLCRRKINGNVNRKYIKQIKIYDDRFEITFKFGIEINIDRIRID